ncbi:MAG: M15 family metallopeptidase [Bacillota bacterium]
MKKIALIILLTPLFLYAQSNSSELVKVKELIPDIVLDLKYNTLDNFTHQKLYSTNECYLVIDAVKRLKIVQDSLKKITSLNNNSYPKGIGIKIWDGYRPRAIQYLMWDIYPDPTFVADPKNGSAHNRGGAVDLTLIDMATGKELRMPTGFDDFSPAAAHGFDKLMPEVKANRDFLLSIMTKLGGFAEYQAEWWHYTVPGINNYPLLDFQMK